MQNYFKKIRSLSWLFTGFFIKHKKILLASLIIGIASFVFITKILPVIPQPKKTERIGVAGSYTWDTLPLKIKSKASQGLIFELDDGSVVPALAQKWDVSKDGKKYTFTLRKDLIWQDGTDVKSTEIVYPFADVEISKPDDLTIEFVLKEPFAPFPGILKTPVFKENIVGIGKYKIQKISKKHDIIERILLNGPDNNIVYKFYPTLALTIDAFKLGEIDVVENIFDLNFDENWKKAVQIEKTKKTDQYIAAFFNLKDPNLGDKKIRQALAYAVKKDFGLQRAISPISPKSWAYNPEVKAYDFDAEKAKKALDSSLQENSEASESAKKQINKEDISLKITTTQTLLSLADDLKKSWEEVLGIKVIVETVNSLPQDFQVLLIGQEIPLDPDQYPLWHSTQSQNFTHYQSPKVDKLLEDARKTMDKSKRKEYYLEFQKTLVEDAPAVFLYYPESFTISRHLTKTNK